MKVIALSRSAILNNSELNLPMHRLRRRVFRERLDWDVSVSDGLEIDQYDSAVSTYLLCLDQKRVVGCVRLMPTTGPNMLADTFAILLDGRAAPKSEQIWESSRFCVDTQSTEETTANGLRHATFMLFAAMIEFGQRRQLQSIATVTDTRMERILRRAGWRLDRLGEPREIGATNAVAGLLPVTDGALSALRSVGKLPGPALDSVPRLTLAA